MVRNAIILWVLTGISCLADAGPTSSTSPAWGSLTVGLLGGLALFLYGLDRLSEGLTSAAGNALKHILARCTSNRVYAAITGGAVTALIQSSSVTTVLLVGFVSAGLMNLTQAVGVIMGANVGTTVTAQLVAFRLDEASMVLIALGFILNRFSRSDRSRQAGLILLGMGLIFFGMKLMSQSLAPLRSYAPFIDLMTQMQAPAAGILVGALFTALVQSSSATTGIVIALAGQGLLQLDAGIALIFGANIGTCVTAGLASLGRSREAVQVAVVHILFNVIGVLLWFAFIPELAALVVQLSPQASSLTGAERMAAEAPRQIANAHTIFNTANTLILLPFATILATLAVRLVPIEPRKESRTKYLDESSLDVPAVALHYASLECGHLAEQVRSMVERFPELMVNPSPRALDALAREDDEVDELQGALIRYLGKISRGGLTTSQSRELQFVMHAADALERMGDTMAEDVVDVLRKRSEQGIEPGDQLSALLDDLFRLGRDSLMDVEVLLAEGDADRAQHILERKPSVHQNLDELFQHLGRRFGEEDKDRLDIVRVETDLAERLRRIYSLTKRIARQFQKSHDSIKEETHV